MAYLGPGTWPPSALTTERLLLRESEARDRTAILELFASPEVGVHIGGSQPREELERGLPEVPGRRPGFFIVELDGVMIGIVTLERRDSRRPGNLKPGSQATDLGYMFLPQAWGHGYATEACAEALNWFARTLPGEPVVLCAQTANDPSVRVAMKLGFTEVERFEEYGAEQWFGQWSSVTPAV
jgi:RimJ/RimL family protein N-acetyltransferase